MSSAKYCFVETCSANSNRNPDKYFFSVPFTLERRREWCRAVDRRAKLGVYSSAYCCSDHFNLEKDLNMIASTVEHPVLLRHVVPSMQRRANQMQIVEAPMSISWSIESHVKTYRIEQVLPDWCSDNVPDTRRDKRHRNLIVREVYHVEDDGNEHFLEATVDMEDPLKIEPDANATDSLADDVIEISDDEEVPDRSSASKTTGRPLCNKIVNYKSPNHCAQSNKTLKPILRQVKCVDEYGMPTVKLVPLYKLQTPAKTQPMGAIANVFPATVVEKSSLTKPATLVLKSPAAIPATVVSKSPATKPATLVLKSPAAKPATVVSKSPAAIPAAVVSKSPATKPATLVLKSPAAKPTTVVSKSPVIKPATLVLRSPAAIPVTVVSKSPVIKPATLVLKSPAAVPATLALKSPAAIPATVVSKSPAAKPATLVLKSPAAIPATVVSKSPAAIPAAVVSKSPATKPATLVLKSPAAVPATLALKSPAAIPATVVSKSPAAKPATLVLKSPAAKPATLALKSPAAKPATVVSKSPAAKPATLVLKSPAAKPATLALKSPAAKPATVFHLPVHPVSPKNSNITDKEPPSRVPIRTLVGIKPIKVPAITKPNHEVDLLSINRHGYRSHMSQSSNALQHRHIKNITVNSPILNSSPTFTAIKKATVPSPISKNTTRFKAFDAFPTRRVIRKLSPPAKRIVTKTPRRAKLSILSQFFKPQMREFINKLKYFELHRGKVFTVKVCAGKSQENSLHVVFTEIKPQFLASMRARPVSKLLYASKLVNYLFNVIYPHLTHRNTVPIPILPTQDKISDATPDVMKTRMAKKSKRTFNAIVRLEARNSHSAWQRYKSRFKYKCQHCHCIFRRRFEIRRHNYVEHDLYRQKVVECRPSSTSTVSSTMRDIIRKSFQDLEKKYCPSDLPLTTVIKTERPDETIESDRSLLVPLRSYEELANEARNEVSRDVPWVKEEPEEHFEEVFTSPLPIRHGSDTRVQIENDDDYSSATDSAPESLIYAAHYMGQ